MNLSRKESDMLKSALFVFLFSSFLGRLDCAGKPFVPVGINLSDHRDEGHRNAQRK